MDPPRSVLKKREMTRHEDNKHVTFACPNSPATGSSSSKQQRKQCKDQNQVHSDQRKRQKAQQSGSKKKAKHNEQIAQLQQCEEILADIEFDTKALDQKVWEHRQCAGSVLNEMGDLVLRYADIDNKCVDLEVFIFQSINDLDKGEYCAAYRLNYEYYCQGIWTGEKLLDIMKSRHFDRIRIFCPTYKQICVIRNYREHHKRVNHRGRLDFVKTVRDKSYDEILEDLSELVPCTPECDSLVYPHCTKDCKCDYDYPTMQRFCNPPTLPLFLNVCSILLCVTYRFYLFTYHYFLFEVEQEESMSRDPVSISADL
uniref:Uncharacterized protein n=1 Tax=Heterorhabditis bacteriophora TaxID=37862 RepID=A0A1I7W9J8_HETBA